jgi:hypothetical protein
MQRLKQITLKKNPEIPATPQTKHPDFESLKSYVQLLLVVTLCKYIVNQRRRKYFLRYMIVCS